MTISKPLTSFGKPFPKGTPADKIPLGAVVVFSPLTKDSSGHVSFFVSCDSTHVLVLGGNQHNGLNETRFPRSKIVEIRLPAEMPASPSEDLSIDIPPDAFKFQVLAPVIMDKLMKDFEITEFQAAGVLGNIGTECAGFRILQEIKPKGGGRGGLGWCQWTGVQPPNVRRFNFEKFCQDNHLSTTSDKGNYEFLKHELMTSEKATVRPLKASTTLPEAVRIFEDRFERAGAKNFNSRDNFARIALAAHMHRKAKAKAKA